MLTKVTLGGVMGKKFGKTWNLSVESPAEALRMIEANSPGVKAWVIANKEKYAHYEVICERVDGTSERLSEDTFKCSGKFKSIKFVPMVEGSWGGIFQVVVGAVMVAASFIAPFVGMGAASPYLLAAGVSMMVGGVIQMLSPRPALNATAGTTNTDNSIASDYFDGPSNTERQGSPVPLIYGRMLVGSHTISSSISIDEAAV